MKKASIILPSLFGLAVSSFAQTYDFNGLSSAESYASDFTLTGSNFARPGIGLGGTSALEGSRFFGNWGAVQTVSTSFDTSSDFTVSQSIYFNTGTAGTSDNADFISLGVTDQSTQNGGSNYANYAENFVNAGLRMTDASEFTFQFNGTDDRYEGGADFSPFKGIATGGTLSANTWYLFSVDFAYNSGTDQWDIARRVQESDSSGSIVGAGLDITAASLTLANTLGANPATVYGFFGGEIFSESGVVAIDNYVFSTVPEPSSYALIFGALSLGWIVSRRRA